MSELRIMAVQPFELRLHLRYEYMQRGSVKDRLHRSRHIIPDLLPTQHKDA
ncbi:hypothetical protein AZE42_10361 [Rhizopogon vesiculosus]|uniref:Uncharacterized protein n=1 Tax=Rhizopogon vesiculosus TaxID=180088 RepID=A0A1J8QI46_9AGAM|nr:hypothetical protein AZE42_10361 [Rhizopogon vesiculosus]